MVLYDMGMATVSGETLEYVEKGNIPSEKKILELHLGVHSI